MSDPQLTAREIEAAARRIQGRVRVTPVLTSAQLDDRAGARVHVKAEALQLTGSFKVRGAFNRLLCLEAAERRRGVVAYSSGNHAGAVALAAHELGSPATVVIPADAAAPKLATAQFHRATLRRYDPDTEDRVEIATELARERGLTLVPPFDDLDVMAGQGTLGLELAEQAPTLDAVIVPVGGGGLLAGVGTAMRARHPAVRIIGAEPATADDTRQSLDAGRRMTLPQAPITIADGLRTLAPGELTFPVNSRLLDAVVTVSDAEIVEAMRLCFDLLRVVAEPSGATALAALLSGRAAVHGARVGVVLSGGNVDAARFAKLLGGAGRAGASQEIQEEQPPEQRTGPAAAAGSSRR